MTYKEEVQKKNAAKLDEKFKEESVPDFIRAFFTRMASRKARLTYWWTIKHYLNWEIQRKNIEKNKISDLFPEDFQKISTEDIILYFEHLKYDKEILLTTIENKKNQLSSFWQYMTNRRYVKSNVIREIKSSDFKPAKTNRTKLIKMPLPEDMEEMIEKINRKPDEFIRVRNMIVLRVLRGTGLRESELAGLDLSNLYLKEPYPIYVPFSRPFVTVISKGNYDYSESGTDIVWLTRDAREALEEWLEYRKSIENIIDKEAVFVNKNGKRLNEDNIQAIFKIYSKGKITPHMIRHEAATRLAREDPGLAREMLRHKSADTTTDIYASAVTNSYEILDNM